MKLYDFSAYAARRDALRREAVAAVEVATVMQHIDEPGAVVELKLKVDDWFALHRDAAMRVANLQ